MDEFIEIALSEARKALKKDEVPIGAVIVKDGKVIAKGHNRREKSQNALRHAEIEAINKACKKLKSWRLDGCDIIVTLEPCPMCAGAIVNARIRKVYYCCRQTTSDDDLFRQILESSRLNHKTQIEFIENKECQKLLTDFFKSKRKHLFERLRCFF